MSEQLESVEVEAPEVVEPVAEVVQEVGDPLGELFDNVEPPQETGVTEPEVPETPADVVVEKDEVTPEPSSEPVVEPAEPAQTVEDLQKQVEAFKAKSIDERRKRQALEQKQTVEPKKLEFDWDNPTKSLETMQSDFDQKLIVNTLNMSEAQAQARHEDFDAKREVFIEMVQANPSLYNQMISQHDPAEYAYQLAKQKLFTDEVGRDPADYEAKMKAKHFAEFQAEQTKKDTTRADVVANLPPSAKSFTDKNQPAPVVNSNPLDELFDDIPSG